MTTTAGTLDPVAALIAAANAAKAADPQSVVGAVKASSSTHEAVMNVQAIAAYGNTTKLYNTLSRMQPTMQAAAWQAIPGTEQDQLKAAGYNPPNLDALRHVGGGGQHGGFFSALASGWHDFTSAVSHGVSDTLNALGSPIRAVQHAYRAAHVLSEEGLASAHGWTWVTQKAQSAGVTATPAAFRDVLSPSAWAQAWRDTTTGVASIPWCKCQRA